MFGFTPVKMPFYAGLRVIAGADMGEIGAAIALTIVLTPALGRVYGLYPDFVRRTPGDPALERPAA